MEVGEIAAAPVARGTQAVKAEGDAGGSALERKGAGGADDEAGFGEDLEFGLAHR